jgi:hypothetical protein
MSKSNSKNGVEGFLKNLRAGAYATETDAQRALTMMKKLTKKRREFCRGKVKRHFSYKRRAEAKAEAEKVKVARTKEKMAPPKAGNGEVEFTKALIRLVREPSLLHDTRDLLRRAHERGYTLKQLCDVISV